MSQAVPKLILYPATSEEVVRDQEQFQVALQEMGLTGEAFSFANEQRFLAGDKLLQLITFLGCSPYVEF